MSHWNVIGAATELEYIQRKEEKKTKTIEKQQQSASSAKADLLGDFVTIVQKITHQWKRMPNTIRINTHVNQTCTIVRQCLSIRDELHKLDLRWNCLI